MGARRMIHRLGRKFAGHAEVNSQPTLGAQAKKHLFTVGMGGAKGFSGKITQQGIHFLPAKDPFLGMHMDAQNLLLKSGIPLFAKEFHLG